MSNPPWPGLPLSIEVRFPGRHVRHLIDYERLQVPEHATAQALVSMYAFAVTNLRAHLVEEAILDGHDHFEVQVEGQPSSLHTVPLWRLAFGARCRVEWARWKRRHPDAGWRFIAAFRWSGTVWGSGQVRK